MLTDEARKTILQTKGYGKKTRPSSAPIKQPISLSSPPGSPRKPEVTQPKPSNVVPLSPKKVPEPLKPVTAKSTSSTPNTTPRASSTGTATQPREVPVIVPQKSLHRRVAPKPRSLPPIDTQSVDTAIKQTTISPIDTLATERPLSVQSDVSLPENIPPIEDYTGPASSHSETFSQHAHSENDVKAGVVASRSFDSARDILGHTEDKRGAPTPEETTGYREFRTPRRSRGW